MENSTGEASRVAPSSKKSYFRPVGCLGPDNVMGPGDQTRWFLCEHILPLIKARILMRRVEIEYALPLACRESLSKTPQEATLMTLNAYSFKIWPEWFRYEPRQYKGSTGCYMSKLNINSDAISFHYMQSISHSLFGKNTFPTAKAHVQL